MNACILCSEHGGSCCQHRDILVTSSDICRIYLFTGMTHFFEFRKPVDPSYYETSDDDINWLKLTIKNDGTRKVLINKPNNDCIFLEGNGCRLAVDARPLVCRIYPFVYAESRISGIDSQCGGLRYYDSQNLIESMGMNLETAEHWRRLLYKELWQQFFSPVPWFDRIAS